jgi:arylsulfatase A-like enzyme
MLTSLALLSLTGALGTSRPANQPPTIPGNIVVIVMDDVGVDLVGAYEAYFQSIGRPPGTPANTPALDQLVAGQGLIFTNAWSCPSCSPARAQILTGRYPFRTGMGSTLKDMEPVPSSNPGLSLNERLLPELLHTATFDCVAVGKWHLADMDQLALDLRHPLGSPAGRWFDRYAGSLFNLSRPNGQTPGLSVYNDWLKAYASELVPGLNPCGPGQPPCQLAITGPGVSNYATVDTTEDALAALGTLAEPWFLYVAYNACHEPVNHAIPSNMPTASCGPYTPPTTTCFGGSPAADARCVMEALDLQMARLLCAIDPSDTTVIVLGDNGTASPAVLPPYPPSHAKGTLYQGGVQVPLMIRSPYLTPNRVGGATDVLVSTADLFATLCELGGVNMSAVTAEDSVSLVPYLAGHVRSLRSTVYAESFTPNFTPDPITGGPPTGYYCERHFQTIRNSRFKLIRRWNRDHQIPTNVLMTEEFYDLLQGGPPDTSTMPPTPTPDPFERNNMLASGIVPGSQAARNLGALRSALDTRYPPLVH